MGPCPFYVWRGKDCVLTLRRAAAHDEDVFSHSFSPSSPRTIIFPVYYISIVVSFQISINMLMIHHNFHLRTIKGEL